MSKLKYSDGRPVEENSPRSARYDAFLIEVSRNGYKTKERIDTLSRYPTANGSERFKYIATLQAMRGDGSIALTCNVRRNWPPRGSWNASQLEARPLEYKLRLKDETDKAFDFTKQNLAKIKTLCDESTNYQIQRDLVGRENSRIDENSFFAQDRVTIIDSFQTESRQLADVLKDLLNQTGPRKQ